jgi:hypothetical protein
MRIKITLLQGTKVIGESIMTLYPESLYHYDENNPVTSQTQLAESLVKMESAINSNCALRCHIEELSPAND